MQRHKETDIHTQIAHTPLPVYKLSIIDIVIIQPCHQHACTFSLLFLPLQPVFVPQSPLSLLSILFLKHSHTEERIMNHKSYECHLQTAQRYEKER